GLTSTLRTVSDDRPPDVVLAYCSSMARLAVTPPLNVYPLVIDLLDVDSAKWSTLSTRSSWPLSSIYRREARALSAFERYAAMRANHTVVVNEREAALLGGLAPDAPIAVVGNGVDVASLKPTNAPTEVPRLVFCGVMNYTPNVD